MENKEMEAIVEMPAEDNCAAQEQVQTVVEMTNNGAATEGNKFAAATKKLGKKVWIIVAAVIVILAAAIVWLCVMSNTYKTPLDLQMKDRNSRKAPESLSEMTRQLNGFSEKEVKAMFAVIEESEEFQDLLEDIQDAFEVQVEDYEDQYGRNYKFSYVIDYKEELEKEDLRNFRDTVKAMAETLEERVEETEDWDSEDWEDEADEMGLSKAEMKSLVRAMEDVSDVWNDIEVTKGYELTVLMLVDGRELDEPEEEEVTIRVFKANGRWIADTAIASVSLRTIYS